MKNKIVFLLSIIGLTGAVGSAIYYSIPAKSQSPLFSPAVNPYQNGVYADGMIESDQPNGANVNLYPEVAGVVTKILVKEGDKIKAGSALMMLDDSVQRATFLQLEQQANAAHTLLEELKAEPRRENLAIALAQVSVADASLKTAKDEYKKQQYSYKLNPASVSQDTLDNDLNAIKVASANTDLAKRQYELTKAGAWSYDIVNQKEQYETLLKSADAAKALLAKYVIRAPTDGVVLAVNTSVGSYVSSLGTYDPYTELNDPMFVMGSPQQTLSVRVYVDEILINRLQLGGKLEAEMSVRGTAMKIPLQFVRIQPYVTPKIELSDERQEDVDVRVLPLIFRFANAPHVKVFPGELVDVYIKQG